MKFLIIFVALFAVALARPEDVPTIVKQESNVEAEGFQYSFETSDGIKQEAKGELKNAGTDDEAIVVQGSFSYTDNDGVVHETKYTADENGYQPQGSDIPTVAQ